MSRAKFTSKNEEVLKRNDAFVDFVLGRMSLDIETNIKTRAGTPVKTGEMKSEVRHFRSQKGQFRVEANKAYSAVQELGMRNGKPFKNYTTPGTSGGWFRRSIEMVLRNRESYILEGKEALKL